MSVPLRGFVQGDSMGLLVFADQDMLLSDVLAKLLVSASVRVDIDDPSGWELYSGDELLPLGETVSSASLSALDRVDLRRVAHPAGQR